MKNQLVELSIPTRSGRFIAHYSGKGLAELDFPSVDRRRRGNKSQILKTAGTSEKDSSRRFLPALDQIRSWHRMTESALRKILAGNEPDKLPPLDPAGTVFQKRVWNALRKIPLGKTRSYGEIARQIGKPRAVRAVGGACGANPIPVLVPCHRVLAANKKIGGFSGGLDWKRTLLAHEGINL